MPKLILICLTCLTLAGVACAERLTVETVGTYRGGESESYREVMDRAKQDAAKQAVEQVIGVYVKSETQFRKFRLVKHDLASWTEGRLHVEVLTAEDEQRRHYFDTGGEGRIHPAWVDRKEFDRQARHLEEVAAQSDRPPPDRARDPLGAVLWGAFEKLVASMDPSAAQIVATVWVDNIIEKRLEHPSDASDHIRDRLESVAKRHFKVVSRNSNDVRKALEEIAAAMSDAFEQGAGAQPGRFLSYGGRIQGTYQAADVDVLLHLEMVDPGTNEKVAVCDVAVPRKDLPPGLSLVPVLSEAQKQQILALSWSPEPADDSFSVEVWPDRGKGATYRKGELFRIRFRASRNCYLRLYHLDSTGRMQYLYPKPPSAQVELRAGVIYTIPDATYGRVWRVCSPYGIDQIKAVASGAPFVDTPQSASLGAYQPGNVRGLLTRGISDETLTAEAFCKFTTQQR